MKLKKPLTVITAVLLVGSLLLCAGCTMQELTDAIGLGTSDTGEGRDSRIAGALKSATDAQKVYAQNLAYTGESTKIDVGTVFLIENQGYFIEYVYDGTGLVTTGNPDPLSKTDMYADNADFKKVTDSGLRENILSDVTIYVPAG